MRVCVGLAKDVKIVAYSELVVRAGEAEPYIFQCLEREKG